MAKTAVLIFEEENHCYFRQKPERRGPECASANDRFLAGTKCSSSHCTGQDTTAGNHSWSNMTFLVFIGLTIIVGPIMD